jgi:hypothetical protein
LQFFLFALLAGNGALSQEAPSPQPPAVEQAQSTNNQKSPSNHQSETKNRPSAIDFFTAEGLQKISNYCAAKPEVEPDKWLHEKFICDIHLTDIGVAVFTGLLVFVTIPLTLIGIWQGVLTRSTARRQLRAYLSISPAFVEDYGTKKRMTVNCLVENHGQTPAFDIAYVFTSIVMPEILPEGWEYTSPQRHVLASSTSFPGIKITAWFHHENVLTHDEYKEMESGNTRLYVWGLMTYRDAFRKRRETQFNFSIGGPDFVKTMQNRRAGKKEAGPGYVFIHGPRHGYAS